MYIYIYIHIYACWCDMYAVVERIILTARCPWRGAVHKTCRQYIVNAALFSALARTKGQQFPRQGAAVSESSLCCELLDCCQRLSGGRVGIVMPCLRPPSHAVRLRLETRR